PRQHPRGLCRALVAAARLFQNVTQRPSRPQRVLGLPRGRCEPSRALRHRLASPRTAPGLLAYGEHDPGNVVSARSALSQGADGLDGDVGAPGAGLDYVKDDPPLQNPKLCSMWLADPYHLNCRGMVLRSLVRSVSTGLLG